MKVLAVLGSPHKNGPTTTITKELLRGAKEAGHEIVEYYVDDMLIKGCKACGYCKEHMVDCIIKDDMIPYWKDFHECGALIAELLRADHRPDADLHEPPLLHAQDAP